MSITEMVDEYLLLRDLVDRSGARIARASGDFERLGKLRAEINGRAESLAQRIREPVSEDDLKKAKEESTMYAAFRLENAMRRRALTRQELSSNK